MILAMMVKPQHAGLLGKIGPYLPCCTLSSKTPPFGIAIAAGLVQSPCWVSDIAASFLIYGLKDIKMLCCVFDTKRVHHKCDPGDMRFCSSGSSYKVCRSALIPRAGSSPALPPVKAMGQKLSANSAATEFYNRIER